MANPLEAFKKLPTWGKVAIGVGGVGVTYFAYKQHQAAASTTASNSTSSQIDPLTGMPYSQDNTTDPLTGQTYLAEAQQYGSVSAAESAYSSGAAGQYYDSGYGSVGALGGYSGYLGNGTVSETYTTNAQWAQAVETGLTDIGYSSTDVAGAIGYYLSGIPLTADQATIVYDAIAEFGEPPTGAPAIQLTSGTSTATSGNTGTTTTGTSTGSTSTGSSSTGSTGSSSSTGSTGSSGSTSSGSTTSTPPPVQTSTVSAGHMVSHNNNDVVVAWSHSGPATSWKVTLNFPGSENGRTATVGVPQATYSGLPSGHSGYVTVQPLPSGQSGNIDISTT